MKGEQEINQFVDKSWTVMGQALTAKNKKRLSIT